MGTYIYEQHVEVGGSFNGSGGFASCTLSVSGLPVTGEYIDVEDRVTSAGSVRFTFEQRASLAANDVPADTEAVRRVVVKATHAATNVRDMLVAAINAAHIGVRAEPSGATDLVVERLRSGEFPAPTIVSAAPAVTVSVPWGGGAYMPPYAVANEVAVRRPLDVGGMLNPEWTLPGASGANLDANVFKRGVTAWMARVLLDIHAPNTELSVRSQNGVKRVIFSSALAPTAPVLTDMILLTYGERLVLTTGVATAHQFARVYARPTEKIQNA